MAAITPRQPLPRHGRESAARTGMMVLRAPSSRRAQEETDTFMSARRAASSSGPKAQRRNPRTSSNAVSREIPSPPRGHHAKEGQHNEEDDAADFRAMRQQVKEGCPLQSKPTGKQFAPNMPRASNGGCGLNVDPCYFDYQATYKSMQAAKEAAGQGTQAESRTSESELVQFLRCHGLMGPLQSYAKALALQGITDSSSLILADEDRLTHVLTGTQMECTDELLLRDALRAFH
mmetsp:Transcript_112184/g.281146  ORF Transcript_112184/g.281146 Transcript_112184/m.281146 type:complete len:233 (+) Transcript_112184:76-774(+)